MVRVHPHPLAFESHKLLISLEYLLRRNLLKTQFTPPCSYMAVNGRSKLAIAIHPIINSNDVLVKYWFLDVKQLREPLPPCQEMVMSHEKLMSYGSLPIGYKPVGFFSDAIPCHLNKDGKPMSEKTFERHYDSLLLSDWHLREMWLWQAFTLSYGFEFSLSYGSNDRIFEDQQYLVQLDRKKHWQYWNMWKLHMLFHHTPQIAPELALFS